jgi:lysozyme
MKASPVDHRPSIGIDVSHHQGKVDWRQVKRSGISFAFIRVSDGATIPDRQFGRNWRQARKHAVLRGAYQYFRVEEDPVEQAELLLSRVLPLLPGDLPPAVDVEAAHPDIGPVEYAARLRRWIEHVHTATGRAPLVYTRKNFWDRYLGNTGLGEECRLWVAHYDVEDPALPDEWQKWTFHQFSDSGNGAGQQRVKGVNGPVDLNRFNGKRGALRQLALGLGARE